DSAGRAISLAGRGANLFAAGVGNHAPMVDAGANRQILLSDPLPLRGTVRDDSYPLGSALQISWQKLSGPGAVTFAPGDAASSSATFSQPGLYVLRLRAFDSQLTGVDEVVVYVGTQRPNRPPTVFAGRDLSLAAPGSLGLQGSVEDDGLPGLNALNSTWSVVSGPGAVEFGQGNSSATSALFHLTGTYVLRLTVTDSEFTVSDEVIVRVGALGNQPPFVYAGQDQTLVYGETTTLTPTIDDGLASGGVSVSWSVVSGPGNVQLGGTAEQLTVSCDKVGTYTLRLEVSTGIFTASDDVLIHILSGDLPAPQVNLSIIGMDGDLAVGQIVTLAASATQPVGSIHRVEFLADGVLLGSKFSPPYNLDWRAASAGSHVLSVIAYDSFGVSTSSVPIHVNVIVPPPSVKLVSPVGGAGFATGSPIALAANASVDGGVERVDFYSNGNLIGSDSSAPFTATWNSAAAGTYDLSTTAVLASNGETVTSVPVRIVVVVDPGTEPILDLVSPPAGAIITAPTVFTGIIESPIAGTWHLDYKRQEGASQEWTQFAAGSGEMPPGPDETGSALGTLDTTRLPNGAYDIRLVVRDQLGRQSVFSSIVLVDGDMKIGAFITRIEDVNVPIEGLPLTVARTYDSHTAASKGDFGYGWNLDVATVRLTKTYRLGDRWNHDITWPSADCEAWANGDGPQPDELCLPSYAITDDNAHTVSIVFPDGRTHHFRPVIYYKPTHTVAERLVAPWRFFNEFEMVFEPLPGTRGTLAAAGVPSSLYMDWETLGGFVWLDKNIVDDPDTAKEFIDATGWTFTDGDGISYRFDARGKLLKMETRQGVTVEIRADGIYHSNGQSVTWTRDAAQGNRITAVTDPAGRSLLYNYSTQGNLIDVTDRDGNKTRFDYNPLHQLTDILDARGIKIVANSYDPEQRLSSTTDAAGITTVFEHDLDNRFEIAVRNGVTVKVRYNERGNVLERIDPDGVRTTFTYAMVDGVETSWPATETVWARMPLSDGSALGGAVPVTTQYFYDDENPATPPKRDGLLRRIVDPEGRAISLTYSDDVTPEAGRSVVSGAIVAISDARENALAQAEGRAPRATVSYRYYDVPTIGGQRNPLFGQPNVVTDAMGHSITLIRSGTPSSAGQIKLVDRQVTSFDANGAPVPQTLHLSLDYDTRGYLSRVTTAGGAIVSYSHDAVGKLVQEQKNRTLYDRTGTATGTEGLVAQRAYDGSGRVTREWMPDRSRTPATETWTDGDGQGPSSETVYNALGKPATTYDSMGRATSFTYENRGYLFRSSFPDGTVEETFYDDFGRREYERNRQGIWTRRYYDAAGRETRLALLGTTLIQTPGAGTTLTQTFYDDLGNVWKKVDGEGNVTTYVADKAGRPRKQINARGEVALFSWDENGNLTGATEAADLSRAIAHQYDALNRRTNTIYPATSVEVNGAMQSVASERRVEFDELGRRIAEYDLSPAGTPLGNRPGRRYQFNVESRLTGVLDALNQFTAWSYDEAGNRLSQTDAQGRTTRYRYDQAGRRTERILPGGEIESRQYNGAGQVTFLSQGTGVSIAQQFDAATGRLLQRATTTNGQTDTITFGYDNATGLRTGSTDATGTTTYLYDQRNRLIEKRTPLGPVGGTTLFYEWTQAGKIAAIRSSTVNGVNLDYRYDKLNRLEKVLSDLAEIGAYGYDTHGDLASSATNNGVTGTYTFDALKRLTRFEVNRGQAALRQDAYAFSPTGQRTGVTELGGRSVQYDYDNLRRLTQETVAGDPAADGVSGLNGTISYNYSPAGNRLNRTVTDSLASVLPSVPQYQYSASDELTNMPDLPVPPAPTTELSQGRIILDADGNLVRKIVGSGGLAVTTDYLVSEHNPTGCSQVVEEFTQGNLSCVYDWGLRQIRQRRKADGGNDFLAHYFVHDGAGNVRGLTDAAGNQTDVYDYDAFGNTVGQFVIGNAAPAQNEYGFAGERFDANAQGYHLRSRFYNPNTGRLIGEDPFEGFLQLPASLHRYTYAQNDPVNLSDPSGTYPTLAGMMMKMMGA
ncbi:MAG: Ig-like domain-containing protein, partial [Verrucomicrobiota bacterium]